MTLDILTPDKQLFEGEATYVGIPGTDGSLGILSNHAPLVTTLRLGEIVVKTANEELTFEVKGGTVEVLNNHVTILAQ
ncbi:MAG TPA: ATP synthase F1 subunit epsilon [Flavobacteriales bacterium]|jgi:F-type H+-transporting ATPase subunit epsilon|nr:ATP synthase F1 subunit epsilon [Flavobacteriales bacterium]HIB77314.1 ATP synthase F1 subunit epsilon [Flavobacteriales bacterium]HIN41969.1 ATP synthase F1 subunit epsilon [Flavobacteriales bacterium]HIO15595.1 ATP synthase F1 subunit epsilon [Flavobacteriales bacterium]HIO58806.1 ATP synthase F1 subunit epsilon [Flavobacteriales bacterium]